MEDVFDQRLLFRGHDTEADELETLKGETGRKYVWLADRLRLKGRLKAAVKEYRKATREELQIAVMRGLIPQNHPELA